LIAVLGALGCFEFSIFKVKINSSKGAVMADNTQSFVDSETQRIYAEYKRQAEAGGSKMAYQNHSEESTAEAFCKASESLAGDFAKATGSIV
jgi:FKBP-type peptidyl-prolyl cis-trans isomerase (trigger factor)